MSEKNELKEEELEEVTGGYPGNAFEKYGFSGYVDRYAVQAGQTYFFTCVTNCTSAIKGYVTWTGERDRVFGSCRTHIVNVLENDTGFYQGCSTADLGAGEWAAYTVRNGRHV